MNLVEPFLKRADENPERLALWTPGQTSVNFGELRRMVASAQSLCLEAGLIAGDPVLFLDRPSPRLYAGMLAVLASGGQAVLLEPWISVEQVQTLIERLQPKIFFSGALASVLASRLPVIRAIPKRINPREIHQDIRGSAVQVLNVPEDHPALATFTTQSGRGFQCLFRCHGPLRLQFQLLGEKLFTDSQSELGLALFSNAVFAALLTGRGSLLVRHRARPRVLRWIASLPPSLAPTSVSCPPAFLSELLEHAPLPSLKKITLQRAIADCSLLKQAFQTWPHADFQSIYGSSACEPLCATSLKQSVKLSQERGFIQALYLGQPLSGIQTQGDLSTLAVQAPHIQVKGLSQNVSAENPSYFVTGDRIQENEHGWWYRGNTLQPAEDFDLEQKIYSVLGSSHCFIHRSSDRSLHLIGPKIQKRAEELQKKFPELKSIVDASLERDRRHRSWIDRTKVVKTRADWLT